MKRMTIDLHDRYQAAISDLETSLSDSTYRPVESADFCQKHNLSSHFLNAVRHMGGVQADTGRSTPATHWLIKLEELKDLTPNQVDKQMQKDVVSTAKPVSVAKQQQEPVPVDQMANAPALEQATKKLQDLNEWAAEVAPITDAFASLPGRLVQGQVLEVLRPTLPEGTRCASVSAIYDQPGKTKVVSEFMMLRHSIDENGQSLFSIETGRWAFARIDDVMAVLHDFQSRAIQADAPAITE